MVEAHYTYEPDIITPPGDTLGEMLNERRMSQKELADRTGRPIKTINEIIKGKSAISPETALQFEKVFGASAGFWIQREAHYREYLSRVEEQTRLNSYIPWLDELPLAALRKNGVLSTTRNKIRQVVEMLNFFGVASPAEWRRVYTEPQVAYRISSPEQTDPAAIAAWLRMGELRAQDVDCAPFDKAIFRNALNDIRKLTVEAPDVFVPRMTQLCRESGVAVVFIPALPRCRVSGVARWLSADKALIQLSLFGKYNDRLWFSFFHEAGHLLLHGKRLVFLDGDKLGDGPEEESANKYAANFLIPEEKTHLLKTMRPSANLVHAIAMELGIHPGIIVGRMQHDGLLLMSHLNRLKDRFEFVQE